VNFPDTMEAYALDPTPEHLEALHRAITEAPSYDPMVAITQLVTPLVRAGDHQGVVDALRAQMPGIFLSPAAHMHLSQAYAELGKDAEATRERKFALLAMDSIRTAGEGTEESPYPVLRVEDEYAVLDAVRHRSAGQQLVRTGTGACDVHTLEDGSQMWFRLLWREPRPVGA
jgi:hypothetical protein